MGGSGEPMVLALDLGTSGPKAAVVGIDGAVRGWAVARCALRLTPDGGAEQDPDDWWRAITEAVVGCRAAVSAEDWARIAAVGVTGQWSGTVAVDERLQPTHPALIWLDSRGAQHVAPLVGGAPRVSGYSVAALRTFLPKTGGLPSRAGKDPVGHIAFLRAERAEAYEAARWFLEPLDYLVARITGRVVSSHDCIALHWATDNRRRAAIGYREGLLRAAGLPGDRLPPLLPSTSVVAETLPEVAAVWGLPRPVPVATATADLHSAVLGSGSAGDYEPHLYLGTSSWISCHLPSKRVDIRNNQTSLPAALPDRYLLVNEQEAAGAALDFVREQMLEVDHDRFEALAGEAAPGAGGLVFTPWLNGERTPVEDHTLRGGMHNLSLATTRADLARAAMEGVACNSRWLLEAARGFLDRPMGSLAVVGGGALSDQLCQVLADVTDTEIRQMAQPRLANVRGAAIVAMAATGLAEPREVAAAAPVRASYRPRSELRQRYEELYGAFGEFHRRTRGIYRHLNGERLGAG